MKIVDQYVGLRSFLSILLLILILSSLIGVHTIKRNDIFSRRNSGILSVSTPDRLVKVHSLDNYLGMYIRGEDVVSISGSLVTQSGDPVSNAEIYVYLNISDDNYIFIGTYQTDESGYFSVSFLLPMNVPEGNRTITIYSKPDPWSGIGSATAYYWLYVFSRVHVILQLERNEAALFEKNISFSVSAYFDNGTIVERENMSFLVNISHDSQLDTVSLRTGPDGIVTGLINFTSPGTYAIEVIFNTSKPENFLSEFVLADEQYIVDGSLIGETISSDQSELSVYLADRIIINFEVTQDMVLQVFRNGTSVTIVGRYFNISGYPDQHPVNLSIVYFGEDSEQSALFVNLILMSNQDGFFSYSFVVNESFYPGNYMILCDDLNDSTLDIYDPLSITVISNMSLEVEYIYPDPYSGPIASGSSIRISGYVLDGVDGRPIEGALIEGLMINDLTGSEAKLNETFSESEGYFLLVIELPLNIDSETITITLRASGSNYYLIGETSFSLNVYNYIVLLVSVNSSNYFWFLRNGLAIARNDTTFASTIFPASLNIYVSLTDDFNRTVKVSRIIVMVNGSTIYEFQNVSETSFSLVDVHAALNVTLVVDDLDIEVSLFILGQSSGGNTSGGVAPNIPISIIIIISVITVPLIIIGFIGEIKLVPEERGTKEKESILGIVLNIERAGIERKFLELAAYIRMLFNQLASDSGVSISSSLTTREIYDLLLEKNSKLVDASAHLEYLLQCYEKIVYGFRKLSEDELSKLKTIISDLYIYLRSLMVKGDGEGG